MVHLLGLFVARLPACCMRSNPLAWLARAADALPSVAPLATAVARHHPLYPLVSPLYMQLVPLPGGYTRPGAFLQGVSASVAPASCGLPLRGLASSRVHAAELPLAAGASPEPYGNSDVAPISLASAASAWLASLPKGE